MLVAHLLETKGCSCGWPGLACCIGMAGLVRPSISYKNQKDSFPTTLDWITNYFLRNLLAPACVQTRHKPVFALRLNPWSLGRHNFWRFLHSWAREPAPSSQTWSNPPEHLEEGDSETSAGILWVLEGHLLPGTCQPHRGRSEGMEHLSLRKETQCDDQYTNRHNQLFSKQIRYVS